MSSTWHDGLVQAFPIPESKSQVGPRSDDASTEEASSPASTSPSRFFSLPAEIRNYIYSLLLFTTRTTSSPTPPNRRLPTSLFRTCSLVHAESSHLFYATYPFHLFPLQLFPPSPSLASIPNHYRTYIQNLTLTLGPSWTSPPKSWRVTRYLFKILHPKSLPQLRCLRIFVEIDPSHPVFQRFRVSKGFYTEFATKLLADVLAATRQVQVVRVQGNPSVRMDGPLVVGLKDVGLRLGRAVWLDTDHGSSGQGRGGLYKPDEGASTT